MKHTDPKPKATGHIKPTYIHDAPKQHLVINGQHRHAALAIVRSKRQPNKRLFALWNCGWHIGNAVLTHKVFFSQYELLTSKEQRVHMSSPDPTTKEWRRFTDHIWFEHSLHGRVVIRLCDGQTAILRDPVDDSFVERVPFSECWEVPPFEHCKQPSNATRRCIKERTTKSHARVNPFLGLSLDELL